MCSYTHTHTQIILKLWLVVFVPISVGVLRGQKKVLDLLKMELQMDVNHHMGAENRAHVPALVIHIWL